MPYIYFFIIVIVFLLVTGVLCHQTVGVHLGLRDGEQQAFFRDAGLSYGVEEVDGVVAILQAYQVEPAMSFKSEFYAALVDDFLAQGSL